MKLANCVFLASFGLIYFISVSTADGSANSTDLFLPSQIDKLSCPGQADCADEQCIFNKTSQENATRTLYSDVENQIKCTDLIVRVNYPRNMKPVYQGQEKYTCFIYKNGNGTTFNVAELTLTEPSYVNGSLVTCTADKSSCTLRNETNSVLLFVAGLPRSCVPWSPPPPPPASDLFLPSQIDKLSCPGQANCTDKLCIFSKTSQENASRPFFSDVGIQIKCTELIVRVNYPQYWNPVYQGQDNYTCFIYKNGNGTTFNVAELTLTKPSDVNGSQVTCTADQSSCTLRNETNSVLLFVAGLPSSCVPWSPPPPPPPPPSGNATTVTPAEFTPGDKTGATTAKPSANVKVSLYLEFVFPLSI